MYARCKFSRAASTCPATISTNLINCSAAEERKKDFKPTIGMPDGRRKRDEVKLKIRRDKKDANIRRRRMGDSTKALDEAVGQAITPLGSCQIEQIAQACEVIAQQASTQQELLIAIRNLRKVLGASQAGTSIVEFIVQNGAVPLLINRLKVLPGHSVDLIAQTILTLTNLSALGHNAYLVKEKAVEVVAPFIHHDHPEVRKQTAWCLGNIATENDSYRNWLIRQDIIVKGLIRNVAEPQDMELLEAVIWTMSVLCSCKVSFAIVKGMVSPLCNLLLNHFYELPLDVLIYAVETLMLLSDGPNEQIQVVMDTGITPVLVRLLKGDLPSSEEKSWPLIIRVIRCLGNFTSGTIAQTQIVITAGALAHVGAIIVNGTPQAQKEACWLVSNIAAGTPNQISELQKAKNILRPLALKAYQSDLVVRQEALYALANICNKGVDEHVKTLVEFDALRALTTFIDTSSDVSLLVEVLNAINRVLEVGETESWLEYDRYFYEYSGIERLEKLADAHQSPQIYKLAANILDRFFSSQDTLDENRAPDEISNDSTTPSDWAVKKKLQFDFNSPRTNPNARNGASGFGFQNRGL